jgi:hypothetical protein
MPTVCNRGGQAPSREQTDQRRWGIFERGDGMFVCFERPPLQPCVHLAAECVAARSVAIEAHNALRSANAQASILGRRVA